jgi:hypothetical protein
VICRFVPRDIGGGVIAPMRVCTPVKRTDAPADRPSEVAPPAQEFASLAGLGGVAVSVENLTPEIRELGLREERIERDVEFKLRSRGIRIYEESSRFDPRPLLYVRVHPVRMREGLGYSVGAMLYQPASLVRAPARSGPVITWEEGAVGYTSPPSQYDIRDSLGEVAESFADDFLAANGTN